ncbi:MAG: CHASE2 domain-containing protein [Proteobacteria bacterium]|nr:CHASE2 domain-containing protein [Pseudomonadota bacterium]
MKGLARLIKRCKQWHALAAVSLALLIAAATCTRAPAAEDLIVRAAALGARGQPASTTIAAIDLDSILDLGPWPWNADAFAKILDQLRLLNARIVVLDAAAASAIDPGTARRFADFDGRRFLSAGFLFYPSLADLPDDYEKTRGAAERAIVASALPAAPRDDSALPAMAGAEASIAGRIGLQTDGFSNVLPDRDGVVRRQQLAARIGDRVYPAHALSAAARSSGFTPLISEDAAGRASGVKIGERAIRLPDDAALAIDFAACSARASRIGASAIARGKAPADAISDRIVILGVTEPSTAAMHMTPLGGMSWAELASCAIGQIAAGPPFASYASMPWTLLAVALAAIAFIALIARLPMALRALTSAVLIFCALLAAAAMAGAAGIQLPAAHFALTVALLLAASWIWNIFAVAMPARRSGERFATRISRKSLTAATAAGGAFDPEGRPCEIAAYALDVRGFGSIASSLEPRTLCSFMRSYRALISSPLLEGGALIESWSHDECLAAFGALAPDEAKAIAACRAAISTLHAISAAREDTSKRFGVERLSIGVGIWLGPAAAGDLGPSGGEGFGVAGTAVECASLLRALNRTYRTSILVNDEVCKAAERSFRFRPLDPIAPAGSPRPVLIHELVGEVGVIMQQLPRYLAARSAYLQGDFERAAQLFGEVLTSHPHDGPSQLFLNRSKTLMKSPPRAEWLGVWHPQ